MFPLLATAGSTAGAVFTFAIGRAIGEAGLERYAPRRRLAAFKRRVRTTGAVVLALAALVPPPFPLTPFVLTCGALDVSRTGFFLTFATARLTRFGVEALLALAYGRQLLVWIESDAFETVIAAFGVLATVGTIASAYRLYRQTKASTFSS